jgi:uncharacterized protein (DUF1778 family)
MEDETRIILDDEEWSWFMDLLERPVQHDPKLEKLLTRPSVLEQ